MAQAARPLPDDEVSRRLASLPGWRREGGALIRTAEFASYRDGVQAALQVSEQAEAMDHHPDMEIGYRRVTFRLTSHDAKGITARDFALAGRIDAVLAGGRR